MVNNPLFPAAANFGVWKTRDVVTLRVDLTVTLDATNRFVEWKLRGWAAETAQLTALSTLNALWCCTANDRERHALEHLAQLLDEHCEPF